MAVSGNVTLGGLLAFSFINGFENLVSNTDTFEILTAGETLTGAFSNVASGEVLNSSDNLYSMQVYYGGASPYGSSNVVLTNFEALGSPPSPLAIPEPTFLGFIIVGGFLLRGYLYLINRFRA